MLHVIDGRAVSEQSTVDYNCPIVDISASRLMGHVGEEIGQVMSHARARAALHGVHALQTRS